MTHQARDLVRVEVRFFAAGDLIPLKLLGDEAWEEGYLLQAPKGQDVYAIGKEYLEDVVDEHTDVRVNLLVPVTVWTFHILGGGPLEDGVSNVGLREFFEPLFDDLDDLLRPLARKVPHDYLEGLCAKAVVIVACCASQDYFGEWDGWEEVVGLLEL